MTLVDTNVLIDLVQDDPMWAVWSEAQLFEAQKQGALSINAFRMVLISSRANHAHQRLAHNKNSPCACLCRLCVCPEPRALHLFCCCTKRYRRCAHDIG